MQPVRQRHQNDYVSCCFSPHCSWMRMRDKMTNLTTFFLSQRGRHTFRSKIMVTQFPIGSGGWGRGVVVYVCLMVVDMCVLALLLISYHLEFTVLMLLQDELSDMWRDLEMLWVTAAAVKEIFAALRTSMWAHIRQRFWHLLKSSFNPKLLVFLCTSFPLVIRPPLIPSPLTCSLWSVVWQRPRAE